MSGVFQDNLALTLEQGEFVNVMISYHRIPETAQTN